MEALRDQQLKYEEDSDNQAAAERFEFLRTEAAKGDINLPRAQKFIARAYSAVKQSLDDAVAVKTRGVGGKFKDWLRKVPTDVAAVIALRECIEQCTRQSRDKVNTSTSVQVLSTSIGRLLELEVRIRQAEAVNPLYMKKIHEQVKENCTTSKDHLRALYNTAYKNIMKGEIESTLLASEALQLGKFGVQAVVDAGVILLERSYNKKGDFNGFVLNPEVAEFLTEYNEKDVQLILNKAAGAMMCPPDPWTNLRDGGYLSPRRKFACGLMNLASVRRSERKRLRTEVYTAENMPQVFEAANYIQAQAFQVHKPTVAAVLRLWQEGGGVLGVPTKNGPVKPVCPFPQEWVSADAPEAELAVFRAWKRQCVQYYSDLRAWRGRVREVGGFIKVVNSVAENIWFPVFFDKRGRWYYRGTPNPQGSDLSKAVLHLGVRKPLGQLGVYWLKVHIANCFGYDKVRFDDRAKWTDANWTTIQKALDRPEDSPEVWGTDAPWCMFSAAWELNQALLSANPALYETGLLVQMDATCSGLQHFSAILRDPVGGGFVNLYDDGGDGPKQDIYAKVAENSMRSIHLDTEDSNGEKARMALWWQRVGISRKMAKHPVMTYCYGATLRGTVDFVQDFVEDELGLSFPEGVRPYDYAAYAAKKLFTGIAQTVPAAEACMQWLRSIAKQMPNGKRMEWKSPTGFPVQHDYQAFDEVRVHIRSCGIATALVREYNEDTRPAPMQNAIAPNFVHALDAAHLTLTALDMKKKGLHFVGIHDSFGTHPGDVAELHSSIRESFINLYSSRNVLTEFLWEVGGIGEVPMRGTLELERVRSSEFFFC